MNQPTSTSRKPHSTHRFRMCSYTREMSWSIIILSSFVWFRIQSCSLDCFFKEMPSFQCKRDNITSRTVKVASCCLFAPQVEFDDKWLAWTLWRKTMYCDDPLMQQSREIRDSGLMHLYPLSADEYGRIFTCCPYKFTRYPYKVLWFNRRSWHKH